MVACKSCGKENQPYYRFCLYCGSLIREGASAGGASPLSGEDDEDLKETPLPTPRPPPGDFSSEGIQADDGAKGGRSQEPTLRPEVPSRLCPECKALVPLGFQFCGSCGARVERDRRSGAMTPSGGRLVLIRPDGSEGGALPLTEGVNLVGRGSGPLFDADSYLSPLHLQIELLGSGLFVLRDAGSLNGVFIKITEEESVSDGAVFRIGQELLRFDAIRQPRPLEDGTEIMGSPNPGYWGRIAIIIGRAQDGSCFPLYGDAVVLGRERGDILFAEDGYVSGTHARISYRYGQVFLQDLASSNGTFIKVRGERTVRPGTFVLMGQQLFRVMLT